MGSEENAARIAIVLATYNRLDPLIRSLVSCERAVGDRDYQFIVVDGGSTDGSRQLLAGRDNVVLIGQRGPLTGAVAAFNLGFGYAVDQGFGYICHFNDDAEFVTANALSIAAARLERDPSIGEVAFAFDLRGSFDFDRVHARVVANFGLVRKEAGMAVARAQGDPTGRAWWNPIYRTYGGDSEFGCWLHRLGWRVEAATDLRVHDLNVQDELRKRNEAPGPRNEDGRRFWERWPSGDQLSPPAVRTVASIPPGSRIHLGCGAHRLEGWVNVDGLGGPAVDVVMDFERDLAAIPSDSMRQIYWCHGPEHIHPDRLPHVFAELRRILAPGCKLTVATIDFVGIWRNRFETHKNGSAWNAALYGETDSTHHPFLSHKIAFTHESLSEAFVAAGFSAVRRWSPEEYPEILRLNDYATSCRLVTAHVEGAA